MKKLLIFAAILFAGCSSSSHIILGDVRPAIPVSEVKLYIDPPEAFEVIAIVRGESVTGWTQQQDTDKAIASMKREAAKLGANGVLLSTVDEGGNVVSGIGISNTGQTTTFGSGVSSQAVVTGRAIFVPTP